MGSVDDVSWGSVSKEEELGVVVCVASVMDELVDDVLVWLGGVSETVVMGYPLGMYRRRCHTIAL